jgi:hypothetical protein
VKIADSLKELKYLGIRECPLLSRSAIEAVHKKLPDCKIEDGL